MALKLASAEKERDAAQSMAEERAKTIEDLRDRLDKEGEERRKLTAMLTDQRPSESNGAKSSTSRRWLMLGIGLLIGGVVALAVTQLPIASV
jgi:chemotaxis response regulator CheB